MVLGRLVFVEPILESLIPGAQFQGFFVTMNGIGLLTGLLVDPSHVPPGRSVAGILLDRLLEKFEGFHMMTLFLLGLALGGKIGWDIKAEVQAILRRVRLHGLGRISRFLFRR